MNFLRNLFGKKESTSSTKESTFPSTADELKRGESKMGINVTHSTKELADITADFSAQSMKGEILPPQLWMLMMNESQAKTLITKYAMPAESIFAQPPEIVNLSDGKAAICFTLINASDIRKLVDILTNSVRIVCSGFVIQLPEADHSYLLQKLSSSGIGVNIGKVIAF